MAKRRKLSSLKSGKHQSKASSEYIKVAAEDVLWNDRISQLPSELLVDILSQLTLKEAGRTSVLSTRWRYLWASIRNLDFDASETLDELGQERRSLKLERPIYVSRVNQVIRHHQSPEIDEFTVVFYLDGSCSCDIDNWIRFAFGKGVKRLKLDLRNELRTSEWINCYSFPHSLDCSSLTSIQLFEVNITGQVLEPLLFNCPYLQVLSVSCSKTLASLNVQGPSALKWLELRLCHNMKWLNISAPNLVSFKYDGPQIGMPLKDVPKIREISIEGEYSCYLTTTRLSELQNYFSQLETLTLEASETEKHIKDARLPVFPKLKKLKVIIHDSHISSVLGYTCLIKASPALYKFSLEIQNTYRGHRKELLESKEAEEGCCPHNIKVLELKGFLGHAPEVELAMYLIKNSVMLEKVVFDTLSPITAGTWLEYNEPNAKRLNARARAKQFESEVVRAGAELIIIR